MGIQIVGDAEALKSFGLETDDFGERLERNLSQLNIATDGLDIATDSSDSFKTITIPDLRNKSENLAQARFEPEKRNAASTKSNAISDLELIKKSIESSFDFSGNVLSNEQQIEQLRRAIDGPPSDTEEPKIPVETEVDAFESKQQSVEKNLLPAERCYLAKLDVRDTDIQPIVESINEQFAEKGLTILSFSGSESNNQLGEVVARSAIALHKKTKSRILIIDCDLEQSGLSKNLQVDKSRGLTALNNSSVAWDNIVVPTSFQNIDVVTVGPKHSISEPKITQVIRTAVGLMQDKYDFVLVNAGNAHHTMSKLWSKHVNGTFLLVSLKNSNQEIAKSAVTQLNQYGARLIGCVVSETD